MEENIKKSHNDSIDFTKEGLRIQLFPYVNDKGVGRLKWKIGDQEGNNAVLIDDKGSTRLQLPKGRIVTINRERKSSISIPIGVVDALRNMFDEIDCDKY